MLPLLEFSGDGRTCSNAEAVEHLANHFGLSPEDRAQRSGSHTRLEANFSWAKTYLRKAELLEYPRTRHFRITDKGREVLRARPARIDKNFLKNFEAFKDWSAWDDQSSPTPHGKERKANGDVLRNDRDESLHETESLIPDEQIEHGYKEIRGALADELLERVKSSSPAFFEQLVVDLLVKMGYGGSASEAARVVGKSGDGGIDGIIKEDRLGLDIIYIQAKRWDSVVGASSIRDFAGSLDFHGAKKGVFITSSQFSKDAREFVTRIGDKKIVLVDGSTLAQLMIDHDIGVSTVTTYTIKRLDSDYFEE